MFNNYKNKFNEINEKLKIFKNNNNTNNEEILTNKIKQNATTNELDKKTIAFLKNTKKYTGYIKLINNNYNKNDALWAIYNEIKTESEMKNDIGFLQAVLDKMGNLLYKENKNGSQYILASYYLDCYIRDEIYYSGCLGVGKKKDIRKMIKKENVDLTFEYFENSVKTLIPQYYSISSIKIIYNFLKTNLYIDK